MSPAYLPLLQFPPLGRMSVCCSVHLLWGFVFPVCLSGWVRLVESRPCVKSLPDYSLSLMTAGSSGSIRLTDVLNGLHLRALLNNASYKLFNLMASQVNWDRQMHLPRELSEGSWHQNFFFLSLFYQSSLCTHLKEHSHIVISDSSQIHALLFALQKSGSNTFNNLLETWTASTNPLTILLP